MRTLSTAISVLALIALFLVVLILLGVVPVGELT